MMDYALVVIFFLGVAVGRFLGRQPETTVVMEIDGEKLAETAIPRVARSYRS